MSFLIRSAFWLGLVFLALSGDGESLRATVEQGAAQATRVIAREAQSYCEKDPIGCASEAIALGKVFEPARSQDTLRADDLAPAWRGPTVTAARRRPG